MTSWLGTTRTPSTRILVLLYSSKVCFTVTTKGSKIMQSAQVPQMILCLGLILRLGAASY